MDKVLPTGVLHSGQEKGTQRDEEMTSGHAGEEQAEGHGTACSGGQFGTEEGLSEEATCPAGPNWGKSGAGICLATAEALRLGGEEAPVLPSPTCLFYLLFSLSSIFALLLADQEGLWN